MPGDIFRAVRPSRWLGEGEAGNVDDLVGDGCGAFDSVLVADGGGDSMNGIPQPSAVGVNVGGADLDGSEGSGNFSDHLSSIVGRGGKIGLKAEVVIFIAFNRDEAEALWFGAGVDDFENVVVGYKLWEGSIRLDDQLAIQARAFWLKKGLCRLLLVGDVGEMVFGSGSGRYVGDGFSLFLPGVASG